MATLLGRPPTDPGDPRTVALAEHAVDQPVVRGQVVLGQQTDLEGGLGDAGETGLVRRPRLLVKVAAEPVRDEIVGKPFLGDPGVAVVQPCGLGLELAQQGLVHGQDLDGIHLLAGLESAFCVCGHRSLLSRSAWLGLSQARSGQEVQPKHSPLGRGTPADGCAPARVCGR